MKKIDKYTYMAGNGGGDDSNPPDKPPVKKD